MGQTHITDPEASGEARKPPRPLRQLLWRSYIRTALIPLLVIEVGFLATYWVSATMVYDRNVQAVSDLSRSYFRDLARREAQTISTRLEAIASHTRVFASQTLTALEGNYMPPQSERARYAMTPDGVLYTTSNNGTTASIYSNRTRIGPEQMGKVWRLSALDPYMKAIVESNDTISSVYFNTFDSYNRIYPYFNVLEQYPHDINVPAYNFYYEADAEHNPERRQVWTDAYVDPAGHGWMVSSIAPVWGGDRLEGVVGIDVTLETLIDSLLDLDLPWGGYAVLVDENGGIIALPPAGEEDFGLTELTSHHYSQAIGSDTFKPDTFNVFLRADTRDLAESMRQGPDGEVELNLGGARLASFATVPQTGWNLVIVAPTDRILADANALNAQLKTIGLIMLGSLFAFYLMFFAFLLTRARRMSDLIAKPLTEIADLIDTIGQRGNEALFAGSQVDELDKLGNQLMATGRRLIEAEDESRKQSRIAKDALTQVREANEEMVRFTRQMSHQIRTPLAIIDGSAQIIQRKAGSLEPDDLRDRANRLRHTVTTIAKMLTGMVDRFDSMARDMAGIESKAKADLRTKVLAIAEEIVSDERLELVMPSHEARQGEHGQALLAALREVLTTAVCEAVPASRVGVLLTSDDRQVSLSVSYGGAAEAQSATSRRDNPALARVRKSVEDFGGNLTTTGDDRITRITMTMPLEHTREKFDA